MRVVRCRGDPVIVAAVDVATIVNLDLDGREMILLENVGKQFEGKRRVVALSGVTLQIQKGEMVSIVGPSGSGKSTLLNMIGALDRPSSGNVSIDGQPLELLGDDDLTRVRRDKIGFIFQFFNL